ncbi:MAG: deoxyribose-phosphate aldolase [Alphaproteobacteria bacterium]|nr:deoxyribose-phosphate aldolase [Alphaproteobacteria bacterium SS10]
MAAKPTAYDPSRFEAEIAAARATKGTEESAGIAARALDLTTLDDDKRRMSAAARAHMKEFLATATDTQGLGGNDVAAVCVFPDFVRQAFEGMRHSSGGVATVVNFPAGKDGTGKIEQETAQAVRDGAREIDVVIDFDSFKAGDEQSSYDAVAAARKAAPDATIKVILETNQLQDPDMIYRASRQAIAAGGDMLKTSTGKNDGDVTLEHAAAMLAAIKDSGEDIGLKISKGVSKNDQAAQFIALADNVMGDGWASNNENFRFGASGLRNDLAAVLNPPKPGDAPAPAVKPGASDY